MKNILLKIPFLMGVAAIAIIPFSSCDRESLSKSTLTRASTTSIFIPDVNGIGEQHNEYCTKIINYCNDNYNTAVLDTLNFFDRVDFAFEVTESYLNANLSGNDLTRSLDLWSLRKTYYKENRVEYMVDSMLEANQYSTECRAFTSRLLALQDGPNAETGYVDSLEILYNLYNGNMPTLEENSYVAQCLALAVKSNQYWVELNDGVWPNTPVYPKPFSWWSRFRNWWKAEGTTQKIVKADLGGLVIALVTGGGVIDAAVSSVETALEP